MMLPLLPLLLQILFLVLVTSYGRYLVILGERRRDRTLIPLSGTSTTPKLSVSQRVVINLS